MTGWRPTAAAAAKGALKAAAYRLAPAADGVTILIYHRVGAPIGGEMTLDRATFARQLDWLHAHRRVVSLDQAADELAGVAPPPANDPGAVVLTFDDGSQDWIEHALPELERHGSPATWYVATGFIDAGELPDGMPAAPWSALAQAAAHPLITLGSHTHRHLLLDRLDPAEIGAELDRSIERLRDETGVDPRHFAYPKAVPPSPAAAREVAARFRTAVLAGTRPNRPGADLHQLARSPIQASDTDRWFAAKANGGMRFEDDVRVALNRVRYRSLTG